MAAFLVLTLVCILVGVNAVLVLVLDLDRKTRRQFSAVREELAMVRCELGDANSQKFSTGETAGQMSPEMLEGFNNLMSYTARGVGEKTP